MQTASLSLARNLMPWLKWWALMAVLALWGCTAPPPITPTSTHQPWTPPGAVEFQAWATAPLLLLGEQHDAPEHHRIEADLVQWLISQQRLGALVLEMADEGRSTVGLHAQSSETQVQEALGWAASGWPWADYRLAIMAAVRAQVPVLGGNLPRKAMRGVMTDTTLDGSLDAQRLALQDQRMIDGHCGLLPANQTRPMTRVQIARDQRMALTMVDALARATSPQAAVLLLAGQRHVDKMAGVPVHLARLSPQPFRVVRLQTGAHTPDKNADPSAGMDADLIWHTPALPPIDHCSGLLNR